MAVLARARVRVGQGVCLRTLARILYRHSRWSRFYTPKVYATQKSEDKLAHFFRRFPLGFSVFIITA